MDTAWSFQGKEKKFFDLCTKVCSAEGFHLYDLEYQPGQHLLRVYIMNPETKTALIEDCVRIDRAMTPYIEEEEWMPAELNLEVSSPGLYRSLKVLEHFEMAKGERVSLTLLQKLTEDEFELLPRSLRGQKKFSANLVEITSEKLELEFDGYKLQIEFENIKKAQMDPEL